MKNSFAEQRTAFVNEVLDLINKSSFEMLTPGNLKFVLGPGQAGMILNEDEIYKILKGLDQNNITIINNIIELFCGKGLFVSFFPLKIKYLQII